MHVVRDFRKILGHINGESKNETDEMKSIMKFLKYRENQGTKEGDKNNYAQQDIVPEHTIQEANDTLELLRNRQAEIRDLEDAAVRTSHQVREKIRCFSFSRIMLIPHSSKVSCH